MQDNILKIQENAVSQNTFEKVCAIFLLICFILSIQFKLFLILLHEVLSICKQVGST